MTRFLAFTLAAILLAAALAGCAASPGIAINANIRVTSSDAADAAAWLTERLGERLTGSVVIGTNADGYGVDVSSLESDGFFIRSLGCEDVLFARTADGLDRAVRRYAKAVEAGDVSDVTYHEGHRVKSVKIAARDVSEYTIFCEDGTPMRSAANELSSRLAEACGASLAVSTDAPAAPYIALRYVHDDSLSTVGYRWSVSEDGLALECSDGYKPSSPTVAVRRFLETNFNWMGMTVGYPELESADVISFDAGESGGETNAFPAYNIYGDYYSGNAAFTNNLPTLSAIPNSCHGLQNNKFAGDLSTSEGRDWAWDQPCWLSEDFYEVSREDITAYIERVLATGAVIGEDFFFVDVAHGDNAEWCWCKECTKLYRAEGPTFASHILTWINRLSEELNETYPGLYYGIFAYQGTNKLPKTIRPNEHVFVTYCYDDSCSAHSIDGRYCDEDPMKNIGITWRGDHDNRIMSADLLDWLAVTKNVYVWYYGLMNGFSTMSFVHTVRDDITFFYENGVKGVFWESEDIGFSTGKISKLLAAELLWDIDMTDGEYGACYTRVLRHLYGEDAVGAVREYVSIQDRVYQNGRCMTCWSNYGIRSHMSDVMYREVADELFEIIESAIPLADTKMHEQLLWRLSCENVYKTCSTGYFTAYNAGDDERVAELSRRYDLMISRTDALGVDVTSMQLAFVNWEPLRIGYERDLEVEAWTKKDIEYSDFSIVKPTREMPERVAAILAERKAAGN